MSTLSLLQRLKNAEARATSRLNRRNMAMRDFVASTPKEARFSDEFMGQYKKLDDAHAEARTTRNAIADARLQEQLSRDLENATGDAARFRDEVVNFVGPRWSWEENYTAPRQVRQKDIKNLMYDDAYNMNEIPESMQKVFLDNAGRDMRPIEDAYSIGVYGVNGKSFHNKKGDKFYVPNRSTNVFRR